MAAEAGTSGPLPIIPIWQEVVLGTVAFAVLCFVLMKFVFPAMEKTFAARIDAVEGGMKRAAAAQAEANELLEQYRAELAQARTEAARIRDEARADAEGIRQGVLSKAREESDRIVAVGGEQLAAQREHILRDLRSEVNALAVDLASRIVGEPLVDTTRDRGEFGVSAIPSD